MSEFNNEQYVNISDVKQNVIQVKTNEENNSNIDNNVKNKTSEKQVGFIEKLKPIIFGKIKLTKGIKVAVLLIVVIVLGVVIINFSSVEENNLNTIESSDKLIYTNSLDYSKALEEKLEKILSNISGAGKTKVMITLSTSPEIVLANSTNEKTNTTTNGNNSTSYSTIVNDPIILNTSNNNTPLVVSEIMPKIKGVVVVSEGAKNVQTKLNLLSACLALLEVDANDVQVFAGEKI